MAEIDSGYLTTQHGLAVSVAALLLTSCMHPAGPIDSPSGPNGSPAATCADRLDRQSGEFSLTVLAEAGREVPLTIFLPQERGTYPLIGFSHGAFASPTRYRAMLAPLASAGYILIAPMHIDSEQFGATERPTHAETWRTRNLDMALALAPDQQIQEALKKQGYSIDSDQTVSAGHSYGAVIAQLPGGAMAVEPDGSQIDRSNPAVDAVVGWSPPGEVPGMISATGWSTLSAPTLTITGTTDILPGFIDDWRAHKASYDYAPEGNRAVWVGEGIDHYFGGMFGREKPANENSRQLFKRALEVSLNFMDRAIGRTEVCVLNEATVGEVYQED